MERTLIAVYARAPVPGETKTRLIPALGAGGAAVLHARLVKRVLAEAVAANLGPVELWCAPDDTHAFFAHCAARFGLSLKTQAHGDLGVRMATTVEDGLGRASAVLIVGSDIPALEASHLLHARQALEHADAVFIPAEDGGYVLVGMTRPQPELFADIAWGGPGVMAQTRACAAARGISLAELDPLWDLDRPDDLARLAPQLLAGLPGTQ